MGFETKVKDPRVQASLNSWSGAGEHAKAAAGHVYHAAGHAAKAVGHHASNAASGAYGAAKEVGSVLADHAKDMGKTAFGHAKGATPFANRDLKHRMQHKSGRAIDD